MGSDSIDPLNTTPESWLRMQYAVDLWELTHGENAKRYRGIKPLEMAA